MPLQLQGQRFVKEQAVAPAPLDVAHGDVGVFEQVFHAVAMLGEQGHADAGAYLKLQAVEHHRKADRVLQLLGPLQWVFAGCELVGAHEFIAPHAGIDVVLGTG